MKKYNQEIQYCSISNFDDIACSKIYNIIYKLLQEKRHINIGLSGGSTPIPVLEKLKNKILDWKRISFFLIDERCVPSNNAESNFGTIKRVFFDFIPSTTYKMFDDLSTPEESALIYEKVIMDKVSISEFEIPIFDLILLGMGSDGHIASLFPETRALFENQRLVVENYVPKLEAYRISFTYPLIIKATHKLMLIKGNEKVNILRELMHSDYTDYPVEKLYRNSTMQWIVGE